MQLRNRLAARLYRWIQEDVVLADSPDPWTFAADCRERLTCCSDASLEGLYRCLDITSQDLLRFKLALADWKLIAERFLVRTE